MTLEIHDEGPDQLRVTSTADIGEKARLAQRAGNYETIGIDAIAASANELLSVGALPVKAAYRLIMAPTCGRDALNRALPLPPESTSWPPLADLIRGLEFATRQIDITHPLERQETATPQVSVAHEPSALLDRFELAATISGVAQTWHHIRGDTVEPGDIAIGLRSNGLHTTGIDLALDALERRGGYQLGQRLAHMRGPIADELLRPTRPYVREMAACLAQNLPIRALVNLANGAWLRLGGLPAPVGFDIRILPEPHGMFREIQQAGADTLTNAAMYENFNMGVGFILVVPPATVDAVMDIAAEHSLAAFRLGEATADPTRTVRLRPLRLTSSGDPSAESHFVPE